MTPPANHEATDPCMLVRILTDHYGQSVPEVEYRCPRTRRLLGWPVPRELEDRELHLRSRATVRPAPGIEQFEVPLVAGGPRGRQLLGGRGVLPDPGDHALVEDRGDLGSSIAPVIEVKASHFVKYAPPRCFTCPSLFM